MTADVLKEAEEEGFYDDRGVIFSKAKNYHDVVLSTLKKQVRHWRITAFLFGVGFVLMVVPTVVIILRSELVPIVIEVDKTSGHVQIIEVDHQNIQLMSSYEALQKHWTSQFLICAETFDIADQQRLFDCSKEFLEQKPFEQYLRRFDRQNPDNWFDLYKKTVVTVNITSLNQLPGSSLTKTENPRWIAQFTKTELGGVNDGRKTFHSAILETKFVEVAKEEAQVMANPLTFKVVNYRVERISAPDSGN